MLLDGERAAKCAESSCPCGIPAPQQPGGESREQAISRPGRVHFARRERRNARLDTRTHDGAATRAVRNEESAIKTRGDLSGIKSRQRGGTLSRIRLRSRGTHWSPIKLRARNDRQLVAARLEPVRAAESLEHLERRRAVHDPAVRVEAAHDGL